MCVCVCARKPEGLLLRKINFTSLITFKIVSTVCRLLHESCKKCNECFLYNQKNMSIFRKYLRNRAWLIVNGTRAYVQFTQIIPKLSHNHRNYQDFGRMGKEVSVANAYCCIPCSQIAVHFNPRLTFRVLRSSIL